MASAVSQIAGNGYTGGAVYTAVIDPTTTNDSAANHQVGDLIINTVTGVTFRCVDATASAAVWRSVDVTAISYTYVAPPANLPIFVASRPCTVLAILNRVEIAGTGGACTAVAKKAASGTAMSAGTALHTGTIDLVGVAATNGAAVTLTTANLQIPAGTAIGFTVTGTSTSAVGTITILLLPS